MSNRVTRKKYEENFQKEVNKLNVQQRIAVESIEGPVMVIAGPGTGKTQILSARIGHILKETDTHAHNILCLTYTNAGVHAMRSRLLQFIGPEAHRVHIYTFHSFCNEIIKDNLSLFGIGSIQTASDLQRLEIIDDIIGKLALDHPLKNRKSDRKVWDDKLAGLFKMMKKEHWTPELVAEKADEYVALMPTMEEFIYKRKQGAFQKGDVKVGAVEKQTVKLRKLKAAANLFPVYQKKMLDAGLYDFEDMILWAVQKFKENKAVLQSYQEQYLYILVDEFQDTNGAQSNLLRLLIDYWDRPNIFVVGDDDQAIYEFQGARVKNLTDFYQSLKEEILIVMLTQNYRSTQLILDASKSLIDYNQMRLINQMEDVTLDKTLTAKHPEISKRNHLIRLIAYPDSIHEIVDITKQIQQLMDKDEDLSDVAVIYRKKSQVQKLIELLQKREIPYQTKRKINVLETQVIKKLLTMLTYLVWEYEKPEKGEELLYEILHYDFTGVDPSDITKLAIYKGTIPETQPWREIIGNEQELKGCRISKTQPFLDVFEFWKGIKASLVNLPLMQLMERIINRSGMLAHLSKRNDRVYQIQLLHTFFDFAKQEAERKQNYNLKQLLETIDQMNDNNLKLEFQQVQYSKKKGVILTSAHSAKGLEFKHVFMLDCGKEWEPGRSRSRGFTFPPTLTYSQSEDELEASRRLFYVAMTRTKEFLQISYPKVGKDQKETPRTRYIDELMDRLEIKTEERFVPPSELAEAQFELLTEVRIPEVRDRLSAVEADRLLQGFQMSASSLNKMLECPLSFYYGNVLKVPSVSSESASYGTAVHNTLEWAFKEMQRHPETKFPNVTELMAQFEWEMGKQRAHLTLTQFERRLKLGKLRLPKYYGIRKGSWRKKVDLEKEFRNVEYNGVPLSGAIDKVEYLDKNNVHVVDYKTSNYKEKNTKPPSSRNKIGGDYWRQVVFYKILLENYRNNQFKVVSGEVDYLEPEAAIEDVFHQKFIQIDEEHVQLVGELIETTYQKVIDHDFYTGCGKKECNWCNFTVNYANVDSYRDELTEELDD